MWPSFLALHKAWWNKGVQQTYYWVVPLGITLSKSQESWTQFKKWNLHLHTLLKIFVICNHTLCNWDATACHMQLFLQLCPLFGCVCNYGATMTTFIPTFGWFLWHIIVYIWYIIIYIWYAYTHSCMCNQNRPTMIFW